MLCKAWPCIAHVKTSKYPCVSKSGLKKNVALCLVYVNSIMFNNPVSPEIQPSILPYVPANMTADTWRTWNLFLFLTPCLQLLFTLHRSSVLCCALFIVSSKSAEKTVNIVHPNGQHHTWEATFLLCRLLLLCFHLSLGILQTARAWNVILASPRRADWWTGGKGGSNERQEQSFTQMTMENL